MICTITFAEFKSVWPLIKYNRKYKNDLLGTWNFWILRKFQYWSTSIWKPTNRHPLGLPCHPGLSLLLQHLPSCLKSSSYEMSHSLCNWPSKFVHPIILFDCRTLISVWLVMLLLVWVNTNLLFFTASSFLPFKDFRPRWVLVMIILLFM